MLIRVAIVIAVVLVCAAPAWPCTVVGPLPSAQDLIRRAQAIVRVRAEGLANSPGRSGIMAASTTQVLFTVLDVLKGRVPKNRIEFNGTLSERDDRNDGPSLTASFAQAGGVESVSRCRTVPGLSTCCCCAEASIRHTRSRRN